MAYTEHAQFVARNPGKRFGRSRFGTVSIDGAVLHVTAKGGESLLSAPISELTVDHEPTNFNGQIQLSQADMRYSFVLGPMWLRFFGLLGFFAMARRGKAFMAEFNAAKAIHS